jgi:hypothetical protein
MCRQLTVVPLALPEVLATRARALSRRSRSPTRLVSHDCDSKWRVWHVEQLCRCMNVQLSPEQGGIVLPAWRHVSVSGGEGAHTSVSGGAQLAKGTAVENQ